MSTGDKQEEPFEAYLEGGSTLTRRYRQSSREEPSPSVDEAVLAAARDAVTQPRSASHLRPMSRRWMVPLTLAATVLLSLSLVTLIPEEPELSPEPGEDFTEFGPGPPRERAEGVLDDAAGTRSRRSPSTLEEAPAAPPERGAQSGVPTETGSAAPRVEGAAPPAAPARAAEASKDDVRRAPAARENIVAGGAIAPEKKAQGAGQPTPVGGAAAVPSQAAGGTPASGPAGEREDASGAYAALGERERDSPARRSAATAGNLAAPTADLGTRRDAVLDELVELLARAERSESGRHAEDEARARARVGALRTQLIEIASQWPSTQREIESADAVESATPRSRLRVIERMLEQGRTREVEWQMALFRSRYPEEPLPPVLRQRFAP